MTDPVATEPYKLSWAAAIVAIVLVYPGLLLGLLPGLLLLLLFPGLLEGDSAGMFGAALIISIASKVVSGVVAGALAMYGAALAFRRANLRVVFFSLVAVLVLWVLVAPTARVMGGKADSHEYLLGRISAAIGTMEFSTAAIILVIAYLIFKKHR